MDPKFWGPGLWKFLHSTAAVAYTEQERLDFEQLTMSLARVLPCGKCREHFRANLRAIPIQNYMSDNRTLFMWTYLMHDAVNKAQGKTGEQAPQFEEVYRIYFNVGDDSEADFVGEYQNSICQEVCAETAANARSDRQADRQTQVTTAKVQYSTTPVSTQATSKNSSNTRKFKGLN